MAEEKKYPLQLFPAIERVDKLQKRVVVDKILRFFTSDLAGRMDREEPGTGKGRKPKQSSGFPFGGQLDLAELPDIAFHGLDADQETAVGRTKKRRSRTRKLRGRTIAIWGLSFKPRTDDMREAPSQVIVEELLRQGAEIRAYDPEAVAEARKIFGKRIRFARTPYSALKGADALVLVTEWNVFRNPDFDKMRTLMKYPIIFDGRNQYDRQEMMESGFLYFCLGVGGI